jgi:hypothetical protein
MMKHLESLTESSETQTMLNNRNLSYLLLPELRHLQLGMVIRLIIFDDKNRSIDFFVLYFQAERKPIITQPTLDTLGEHCPKLLQVFRTGVSDMYERCTTPRLLFAHRNDRDSKFRKIKNNQKKVRGGRWRFDYDSPDEQS